jgi:hypothetical protein
MTFVEVGTFIIDVEKIIYVHVVSILAVDIYFAGDVKLRITGPDTTDFLKFLRGND